MTDAPYDAVLVLSFGGPEQPDDVLPFLRNVTRGRNVPDERLAEVAEQYAQFGGRSPINDHCRALIAALDEELRRAGLELPVYWGNRNWHPMLADTVATMTADGVRRALVFATSAFSSYSGCRQYREDLERTTDAVGSAAPALQKLRLFYNHPGFVEPMAANVAAAVGDAEADIVSGAHRIVFTAHSIPVSMSTSCDYEPQLHEAAQLVMDGAGLGHCEWDLVYQSRSGPPHIPWLEPDVNDHIEAIAAEGATGVTLVPIGFVSDHMEVLFDLDTQAVATAEAAGIELRRAATVGTDPRFITMIRQLIEEQVSAGPPLWLGQSGPWPDQCPEGHCLAPKRPAGAGRPAGAARPGTSVTVSPGGTTTR
ncbi:MAG: ferrochelatase [Actinomycetota bacterium]